MVWRDDLEMFLVEEEKMSVPLDALLSRVQVLMGDSSLETKAEIRDHIVQAYYGIAAMRNWRTLRILATQSTDVLPGDLREIYYVEDNTDYIYFQSGIPQRYTYATRLYNFYENIGQATPLLSGSDLATTINSTTVTSATGGFVSATHVGEWMKIGATRGVYKIASVTDTNTIVLTDGFRAADMSDPRVPANLTEQRFEIRPEGTPKILFHDQDGGEIDASSSHKLWYTKIPLTLYNDYDQILLPGNCEAVFIQTLILMNRAQKYDNDALKLKSDFNEELSRMKKLDPVQMRPRMPRDRFGQKFRFGRVKRPEISRDSNNRAIL